ncbi:hypothetical protein [Mycolicibacterium sphagni]|uniref:hypothetical protein n=1 Tax=Mycolicibacterium sphagni TaxID=1786 RepID=UPI001F1AA596|nr:hypothetical protein [Mycolicibacterium sphagni]
MLTADGLAAVVVRVVCSRTAGAAASLPVLTAGVAAGFAEVPVADRCERAVDDVELDAGELLAEPCPESSGAAEATAVPAPEAISKPAPTDRPNIVIRPARLMEVTPAPAHDH